MVKHFKIIKKESYDSNCVCGKSIIENSMLTVYSYSTFRHEYYIFHCLGCTFFPRELIILKTFFYKFQTFDLS